MTKDASDPLTPHVRIFTIGYVRNDPPAPAVLGSSVLLTIGQISGILTCAHVAEAYESRSEIGLLRFSRDNVRQMQILRLGETHTVRVEGNLGEPPWSNPYAFDLAFTPSPGCRDDAERNLCIFKLGFEYAEARGRRTKVRPDRGRSIRSCARAFRGTQLGRRSSDNSDARHPNSRSGSGEWRHDIGVYGLQCS
jgi:hypothetical protein